MTAVKSKKDDEIPAAIRIFQFHRVALKPAKKKGEWTGACYNCGKDTANKFLVNDITGQHNCVACGIRGNPTTFLKWLYDTGRNTTTAANYTELAKDRKIMKGETCRAWGCFKHPITGEWALPGWSADDRIVGVYRYEPQANGKHILKATPRADEPVNAGGHGMFRPVEQLLAKGGYSGWDVCEGPWDGMAFWEAGRLAREGGVGWEVTAVPDNSYLAGRAVVAIPGVQTFFRPWAALMAEGDVRSYFDNDYPKTNKQTGRPIEPAALAGTRRLVDTLTTADTPPASISCVRWGGAGGDWQDPDLPDGYDVRDCLTADGNTAAARVRAFGELQSRVAPVPAEWVPGREAVGGAAAKAAPELAYCDNWKDVVLAFSKVLAWGEGLNRTTAVCYASIVSTDAGGDQLWIKVVGPPSCGKTSIVEAIGHDTDNIKIISKIKGFYSAKDDGTDKNYSLALRLNHKTLVIKDGDTLLTDPNLPVLMGELRDLYDRSGSNDTRNGKSVEIKDHAMTVILCGTESLRAIDHSELGERFLDVVVMDRIDIETERNIAIRAGYKAVAAMRTVPVDSVEADESPAAVNMKRTAGGYAAYLRRNASRLINEVEEDGEMIEYCAALGMFISYARSKQSKTEGVAVRELSFRLAGQLTRLAVCLAVVLNKKSMGDKAVRQIVTQVAYDTSRGLTYTILETLYNAGRGGLRPKDLANRASISLPKMNGYLLFLAVLGEKPIGTHARRKRVGTGAFGEPRYSEEDRLTYWTLKPWMRDLYAKVHGLDPRDDGYDEQDPSEQE